MPRGGARAGERRGGRKPGVPNRLSGDVKAAILEAFERAGGVDYLATIAKTDPKVFCALLGRVLPLQVTGDPAQPLQMIIATGVPRAVGDAPR